MRKYLIIMAAITALSATAQTDNVTRQSAASGALTTVTERSGSVLAADEKPSEPAQPLKFGYLSYDEALRAMPEYAEADRQLGELKAKYDAEAKRVETEFNKKYEEFLEGMDDFPPTILQKRQSELQAFLAGNIAFKEESARLIAAAERDVYGPLHDKLAATLRAIGTERGYAFIINTDNNSCPFVNPAMGEDITAAVKERF